MVELRLFAKFDAAPPSYALDRIEQSMRDFFGGIASEVAPSDYQVRTGSGSWWITVILEVSEKVLAKVAEVLTGKALDKLAARAVVHGGPASTPPIRQPSQPDPAGWLTTVPMSGFISLADELDTLAESAKVGQIVLGQWDSVSGRGKVISYTRSRRGQPGTSKLLDVDIKRDFDSLTE
jgi:hypothetical protein